MFLSASCIISSTLTIKKSNRRGEKLCVTLISPLPYIYNFSINIGKNVMPDTTQKKKAAPQSISDIYDFAHGAYTLFASVSHQGSLVIHTLHVATVSVTGTARISREKSKSILHYKQRFF